MKRATHIVLVLVALIVLWATGGSFWTVASAVRVTDGGLGAGQLALEVPSPGLFLDIAGGDVQSVTLGRRPARLLKPWPWAKRQRVLTLFRGPAVLVAARGAGPFDLESLPEAISVGEPKLVLPEGWSRVGHYVGSFARLERGTLHVAFTDGMEQAQQAADLAVKMYQRAATATGLQPWREPVVVLPGPDPLVGARAVVDLWVPNYAPELDWWEEGLKEFFALRLMDDLKLWKDSFQRSRWVDDRARSQGFKMAVWLDLSLKANSSKRLSLTDLFKSGYSIRSTQELLTKVKETEDLTTYDQMDRMLKGRIPWPAM